jgi:hypothetical protein
MQGVESHYNGFPHMGSFSSVLFTLSSKMFSKKMMFLSSDVYSDFMVMIFQIQYMI